MYQIVDYIVLCINIIVYIVNKLNIKHILWNVKNILLYLLINYSHLSYLSVYILYYKGT